MIAALNHFEEQRIQIEQILLGEESSLIVNFKKSQGHALKANKDHLEEWYKLNFIDFPLDFSAARSEVFIPEYFLQNYLDYHVLKHENQRENVDYMKKQHTKHLTSLDEFTVLFDVQSMINERIRNMSWEFGTAFKRIKDNYVFAAIEDNKTILLNLLEHYQLIQKSSEVQLRFFNGFSFPKNISDIMLDVLIALIEERLNMLEIKAVKSDNKITPLQPEPFKINWLGSQLEFGELIAELKEKNYISFPQQESVMDISKRFAGIFDFNSSKRKTNPDIQANLCTTLKNAFNSTLKKEDKPTQKLKFDGIKSR